MRGHVQVLYSASMDTQVGRAHHYCWVRRGSSSPPHGLHWPWAGAGDLRWASGVSGWPLESAVWVRAGGTPLYSPWVSKAELPMQPSQVWLRVLSCFSHVWVFMTLWTVACQAPLSMGIFRQECWSGLLCPSPGYLPNSETEPASLCLMHCRWILYRLSHRGGPWLRVELSYFCDVWVDWSVIVWKFSVLRGCLFPGPPTRQGRFF